VTASHIVVRAGQVTDAAVLREIRCESLLDSPRAYGSRYTEVAVQPLSYWRSLLRRRHYFIAFTGNEVVGMLCVDAYEHEGTSFPGIYSMFVRPAHRGRHVASLLIDAGKSYVRAKGENSLFLDVVEGNERAIAFYRREGFNPVGTHRAMTSDTERQLITMMCHL